MRWSSARPLLYNPTYPLDAAINRELSQVQCCARAGGRAVVSNLDGADVNLTATGRELWSGIRLNALSWSLSHVQKPDKGSVADEAGKSSPFMLMATCDGNWSRTSTPRTSITLFRYVLAGMSTRLEERNAQCRLLGTCEAGNAFSALTNDQNHLLHEFSPINPIVRGC